MDEEGFVYESRLKFSRMVSLNEVFTVFSSSQIRRKRKKRPAYKKVNVLMTILRTLKI